MQVSIVQDNFPKLQRAIEDMSKYELHVGIFGEDDSGGDSYVMIANVHEFGFKRLNIPERSFMRSTFDEKESEWVKFMEDRMNRVFAFKMSVEQMYEQLGAKIVSDIQDKIRAIDSPPNAASTIKQKGSSNPLIDKGAAGGLLSRITWKVRAIG
ncbi:hypothetical protein JOD44_001751 [Salimicrobium jeotgali]|nr:hypothetical protein [Salimicrobium jeotgali]MBM7696634.1 hypothetical protein [Salimicrobium jeotgali]